MRVEGVVIERGWSLLMGKHRWGLRIATLLGGILLAHLAYRVGHNASVSVAALLAVTAGFTSLASP